jgi:hypothetical protein
MDLRQEESLLSYAELRKTCLRFIMNTRRRLQEVTRRKGGHMEHTLTQKITQIR